MADDALDHIQLKRSQRDPAALQRVLADWLAPHLGGPVHVSQPEVPEGTGVANETVMFEARWSVGGTEHDQGFVLRIASESPLYLDADIRVHHDMYAALADVPGVPVPRVYGYEGDAGLLGAPFFVMERMAGRVPADQPPWATAGFVVDATPDERRAMWDNAVRVLAALHQVDVSRVPFLAPPAGVSGLADHLAYWRRWLDDPVTGGQHDTLDAGYEWLVRHLPADAPTGLSWGDSRFANVMFRGTDVVSIFDWDTVSLAGAGADLAWWRTMDGPSATLPGIGSPDELTLRWQELTGIEATNLEYYDVLTSFRLGAILMRLFSQMGAAGTLPPEVAQQQARESAFALLLASQLEALR
ncbi:MAG: phosphotransferase family protein [Actinomycetota bacterium]|nr:phosphotransferase family protein [Actinomycetota bacterium]